MCRTKIGIRVKLRLVCGFDHESAQQLRENIHPTHEQIRLLIIHSPTRSSTLPLRSYSVLLVASWKETRKSSWRPIALWYDLKEDVGAAEQEFKNKQREWGETERWDQRSMTRDSIKKSLAIFSVFSQTDIKEYYWRAIQKSLLIDQEMRALAGKKSSWVSHKLTAYWPTTNRMKKGIKQVSISS